jgi:hypothetical protein
MVLAKINSLASTSAEQLAVLRSIHNWLRFLGWLVILSEVAGVLWLLTLWLS